MGAAMYPKHFQIGEIVRINNKRFRIYDYQQGKVVLIPLSETGPIRVEDAYYVR